MANGDGPDVVVYVGIIGMAFDFPGETIVSVSDPLDELKIYLFSSPASATGA